MYVIYIIIRGKYVSPQLHDIVTCTVQSYQLKSSCYTSPSIETTIGDAG